MSASLRNLIETISLLPGAGGPADPDERWQFEVLSRLLDALRADCALLLKPAADGFDQIVARAGAAGPRSASRWLGGAPRGLMARILAGETTIELAAGEGGAEDSRPWDAEWDAIEGEAPRWLAGALLDLGGGPPGALAAWSPRAAAAPLALTAASAALGASIRGRALVKRLEEEVITDDLTGIYNYRYLRLALHREIERAGRFKQPLSLIMIDVDHLKEYNDRFGHLGGSRVLIQVASVLRSSTRAFDVVAKYGGDEFVVLLPQTGKTGAAAVAERLLGSIGAATFPGLGRGELTCSGGVAVFPGDGTAAESLLVAADQALFAAKRAGRNRVASA